MLSMFGESQQAKP